MPDTVDAYTHRIGRTGRATQTGEAFTFTSPADEWLVRDIERLLGERIERRKLESFDYGSVMADRGPAQQGRTSGTSHNAAGSRAVVMARAEVVSAAPTGRPTLRRTGTARQLGMASRPHVLRMWGVRVMTPKGNPNSFPHGPTTRRRGSRNAAAAS